MQRHFFSGAVPAQPDKLGRVVIPQFLRAYAQLETDVVVVGLADRIEVWSKAAGCSNDKRLSATPRNWPSTCRGQPEGPALKTENRGLSGRNAVDATAHTSVLLEPVLDALQPRPNVDFRALDCTLGAGVA